MRHCISYIYACHINDVLLRASRLMLEIKEFRCYEVKRRKLKRLEITGSRVHIEDCDCPAVVAQWQTTGGLSQWCPGFNSQRLLAFHFPLFSPHNI